MSTGNIITLAGLGIILTVLSMILLYKQWTKLSQDNIKMPKWMKIYSVIILLSLIAIILIRQSVYEDTDVCDVARDMMIVSLLWVAAAIDKKFYKIPNGIIITGIVYWIAATIYDLFTQSEVCLSNVISELIAVAIIILVVGICLLLMKNSIGMGDLKLLLLVAAFFGLADMLTAVFLSLLVAFVASLVFLIRKTKTRQDVIPFAPFMLTGTMLAIILTGI